MSCEHASTYDLSAGPVRIRYCREPTCHGWGIDSEDVREMAGERLVRLTSWRGYGIETYRAAVADVARLLPRWDGAAFLYGLGGHAHEVDPNEPLPERDPADPDAPF